jgi:hypothetical protein
MVQGYSAGSDRRVWPDPEAKASLQSYEARCVCSALPDNNDCYEHGSSRVSDEDQRLDDSSK